MGEWVLRFWLICLLVVNHLEHRKGDGRLLLLRGVSYVELSWVLSGVVIAGKLGSKIFWTPTSYLYVGSRREINQTQKRKKQLFFLHPSMKVEPTDKLKCRK
jgi:hypothetical protein